MPDRPPDPPDRDPEDSILRHGARLVMYIIRTDAYGLMTAEQLAAADYAIGGLLARQPKKGDEISPKYFDALNDIRRRIGRTLRARAQETETACAALFATMPAAPPQSASGGQRMPRPTPSPTQPPPASYARPQPPKTTAPTFGATRSPVTINF